MFIDITKEDLNKYQSIFTKAKNSKAVVEARIAEAIDKWERETTSQTVKQGKSSIVLKEVAKKIEQLIPEVINPFLSSPNAIEVKTRLSEEKDVFAMRYLNREFLSMDGLVEWLADVETTKMVEGTVWIKSGWSEKRITKVYDEGIFSSEEEIVDYSKTDPTRMMVHEDGTIQAEWEKDIVLESRPTLELIANEDIFPDPEAKTRKDMRFCAVRLQKTIAEVVQESLGRLSIGEVKENAIKINELSSVLQSTRQGKQQEEGRVPIDDMDIAELTNINVIQMWIDKLDKESGQMKPIIIEWIEGTEMVVGTRENPLETATLPFYSAVYSKVPGSLWGAPLSEFLEDMTKVKEGAVRAILDHATETINPQIAYDSNGIEAPELIRFKNGARLVGVKDPRALQPLGINQLSPLVYNLISLADAEITQLSGVNDKMPAHSKSSADTTRQSETMMLTQAKTELSLRFTGKMIAGAMKDWLRLANILLPEEDRRILMGSGFTPHSELFPKVEVDHIDVKVATTFSRQNTIFNINMLLQNSKTLSGLLPQTTLKKGVATLFEAMGDAEEADNIRQYQPRMSVEEELAMHLQLEEKKADTMKKRLEAAKLETEVAQSNYRLAIAQEETRARTITADARAQRDIATAKKLNIEAAYKPARELAELSKMADEDIYPKK